MGMKQSMVGNWTGKTSAAARWFSIFLAVAASIATIVGAAYTYRAYHVSVESLDLQKRSDQPEKTVTSLQARKEPAQDPRGKFHVEAIKATAREVVVGWFNTSAILRLENASGFGFEAAIKKGGTSIGACVGNEVQSSGLGLYDAQLQSLDDAFRYVPENAKLNITIMVGNCYPSEFAGTTSADLAVSLIIRAENRIVHTTISATDAPVRKTSSQ